MRKEELEELRKEQSQEGGAGTQKKQGIFAGWGTVLCYRQVWGITLVRFFLDSILWYV
jgi:hypothetical protein